MRCKTGRQVAHYMDRNREEAGRRGRQERTKTVPEIKPILGVRHAVLKVRDLEKAKQFYCGVLGMEIGKEDPQRGMFLRFGNYHHDIAIFKTGPDAEAPKDNQVGLVHLALIVDSLDTVKAWYERCKAMGVNVDHTTNHMI